MNKEIANALSGYFETLYGMNQRLILLCGIDMIEDLSHSTKVFLDIIQDIPRLIPYSYNNAKKILEFKLKNGLLEFNKDIPYLLVEYEKILKKNYCFLDDVRKIRNKYEHKMHGIKHEFTLSGGNTIFEFSFDISGESIYIKSKDLIKLMKDLNILFSRIAQDVKIYAESNELTDYPYYKKLSRFDFKDFNELYSSLLLPKIGTAMNNY